MLNILLATLGTASLAHVIVAIIIVALLIFVVYWIIGRIGVPEPWKTVIYVVLGLVILIYGLNYFGFW